MRRRETRKAWGDGRAGEKKENSRGDIIYTFSLGKGLSTGENKRKGSHYPNFSSGKGNRKGSASRDGWKKKKGEGDETFGPSAQKNEGTLPDLPWGGGSSNLKGFQPKVKWQEYPG